MGMIALKNGVVMQVPDDLAKKLNGIRGISPNNTRFFFSLGMPLKRLRQVLKARKLRYTKPRLFKEYPLPWRFITASNGQVMHVISADKKKIHLRHDDLVELAYAINEMHTELQKAKQEAKVYYRRWKYFDREE